MLVTCFPTAAWLTSSACADAAVGLALRHRCQDLALPRAEPVKRAVVLTAASIRPTGSGSSAPPPPATRVTASMKHENTAGLRHAGDSALGPPT
jgi:hypothetical protein